MKVIMVRNVCWALPYVMEHMLIEGKEADSRNGPVIVAPTPVMMVMQRPMERVLRSWLRDANPFFHMFEAIWMLAGQDDVVPLVRFVSDFERYADDGVIHGAYGARWRHALGFDQLAIVIDRLISNPLDRQSVIQMWDCSAPTKVGSSPFGMNDLQGEWHDRPCNTHIYLRLFEDALDMTVCCRSNDLIWGGTGANAVHFSILQEYLAARIDVGVGKLYHLSNNAHIYQDALNKMRAKAEHVSVNLWHDPYSKGEVEPLAMFTEPACIDDDIRLFMEWFNWREDVPQYANRWFATTLTVAMVAHDMFKKKQVVDAITIAHDIEAPDWRWACVEWLERRHK